RDSLVLIELAKELVVIEFVQSSISPLFLIRSIHFFSFNLSVGSKFFCIILFSLCFSIVIPIRISISFLRSSHYFTSFCKYVSISFIVWLTMKKIFTERKVPHFEKNE